MLGKGLAIHLTSKLTAIPRQYLRETGADSASYLREVQFIPVGSSCDSNPKCRNCKAFGKQTFPFSSFSFIYPPLPSPEVCQRGCLSTATSIMWFAGKHSPPVCSQLHPNHLVEMCFLIACIIMLSYIGHTIYITITNLRIYIYKIQPPSYN